MSPTDGSREQTVHELKNNKIINIIKVNQPVFENLSLQEREALFNLYGDEYSEYLNLYIDYFSRRKSTGNAILDALILIGLRDIAISTVKTNVKTDVKTDLKFITSSRVALVSDSDPHYAAKGTSLVVADWYYIGIDNLEPEENSNGGILIDVPYKIDEKNHVWTFMNEIYELRKYPDVMSSNWILPDLTRYREISIISKVSTESNGLKGDDIKKLHDLGLHNIPHLKDAIIADLLHMAEAYNYFSSDETTSEPTMNKNLDWIYSIHDSINRETSKFKYVYAVAEKLSLLNNDNRAVKSLDEFEKATGKEAYEKIKRRIQFEEDLLEAEKHNNCKHRSPGVQLSEFFGPVVNDRIICKICETPMACVHYADFVAGRSLEKYYTKQRGEVYMSYCKFCGEQLTDESVVATIITTPVEEDLMKLIVRQYHALRKHLILGLRINDGNFFNVVTRGAYQGVYSSAEMIHKIRGLGDTDVENRVSIYAYLHMIAYIIYIIQVGLYSDIQIEGLSPKDGKKLPLVTAALVKFAEKDLRIILSTQPTLGVKSIYNSIYPTNFKGNTVDQKVKGLDDSDLSAIYTWYINNPTVNPRGRYLAAEEWGIIKEKKVNKNMDMIIDIIKGDSLEIIKPINKDHKYWLDFYIFWEKTFRKLESKEAVKGVSRKVAGYYATIESTKMDIELYNCQVETNGKNASQFRVETASFQAAAFKYRALRPTMIFTALKKEEKIYSPEVWRAPKKFVYALPGGGQVEFAIGEERPTNGKLIDVFDKNDVSLDEIEPLTISECKPRTTDLDLSIYWPKVKNATEGIGAFKPVTDFANQVSIACKRLGGTINRRFIEFMGDMSGRDFGAVGGGRIKYPEDSTFDYNRLVTLRSYLIQNIVVHKKIPNITWWKRIGLEPIVGEAEMRTWCESLIALIISNVDAAGIKNILDSDSALAKSTTVTKSILSIYWSRFGVNGNDAIGDDILRDERRRAVSGIYDKIDYSGQNDN